MKRALPEIVALILLGTASRLVPHLPNMTAIAGVALKARSRFGWRGLLIPLLSMILSDLFIGFYDWRILFSVYASFALVGTLGVFLKKADASRTISVAGIGSTLFFLITNTAVWITSSWYPHTLHGFLVCLAAGLPFLYPMLAGDIFFTLALFRRDISTSSAGARTEKISLRYTTPIRFIGGVEREK